jgi:hypothetical protein
MTLDTLEMTAGMELAAAATTELSAIKISAKDAQAENLFLDDLLKISTPQLTITGLQLEKTKLRKGAVTSTNTAKAELKDINISKISVDSLGIEALIQTNAGDQFADSSFTLDKFSITEIKDSTTAQSAASTSVLKVYQDKVKITDGKIGTLELSNTNALIQLQAQKSIDITKLVVEGHDKARAGILKMEADAVSVTESSFTKVKIDPEGH